MTGAGFGRRGCRAPVRAVLLPALACPHLPSPARNCRRCRSEGGSGCLIPKAVTPQEWGGETLWPPKKTVSKIGFGSCAAYDIRDQPLWEQVSLGEGCGQRGWLAQLREHAGPPLPTVPPCLPPALPSASQSVIPSQPDAWVWLGDFYYADEPAYECKSNLNSSDCKVLWCKQGSSHRGHRKKTKKTHKPKHTLNTSSVTIILQCTADWLRQPPYMCMAGDMDNARDKMVAQAGSGRG